MGRFYFIEEKQEIDPCGELYDITCPKCEALIEVRDTCQMPWGADDDDVVVCPKCGKEVTIGSEYKFLGFYTYYEDDEE